jgi:Arginine/lysine/ornithine decarboxylases
MSHNVIHVSPLKEVAEQFRRSWETLCSPAFLSMLHHITPTDAAELRRAILRVCAYFEDSISNHYLGSIFDRTSKDPLNAMLASIAAAYSVAATVAGTTGTTGLNVPAVMTLAGEAQKIVVGRDCHISVIGGLCLSGAEPVYLEPPFDHEMGVLLPPTPAEVRALLDRHPDARAVVLTMPTYHGLMGNIEDIVAECYRRDVLVMVDAAHGPHFHFLGALGFPLAAEDAGADMITQSTHKVLSALNQGSLLHFNNTELVRRYEEFQSMGFQSTSFSYPILLSIEHAIEQMVTDGECLWARAVEMAAKLQSGAARLPGVRVLDGEIVDGEHVTGIDPTRVTLNVRQTGLSGYRACDALLDRGLIVEMASPDVILFLVSPSVAEDLVNTTLAALGDLLDSALEVGPSGEVFVPPALPERILTPRQAAMLTVRERVLKHQAIGRVSAETIACYPPGQAILVAGERITEEVVGYLTRVVEAGGHLKRVQDDHFQTIDVVRQMD